MRRAGLLTAMVLLVAQGLRLARARFDIEDEVDAAMTLAGLMARLGQLAKADDRSALADLQKVQLEHPLRHLVLRVHAADGRLLLAPPSEPLPAWWMEGLLRLHRALEGPADARQVAWSVARPEGERWTVSLSASHESERREAMGSLLGMLSLLLVCVSGLLLLMRWNLMRAFSPLGRLLEAIAAIEAHRSKAVQGLPTMPIRELESVAAALRRLASALDEADLQRRRLSQQVLTLQEDERARLARELHDEFGQRLTALRVDAAWLARRLADQPALHQVVEGMAAQCELVQQDIRALLTRLQPFGPDVAARDGGQNLLGLVAMLKDLASSWAPPRRDAIARCRLELRWQSADGQAMSWPDVPAATALNLPRALALTLYRISQEALTNVARHAAADDTCLSLVCRGEARPGASVRVEWSVVDDGLGLPEPGGSWQRGNGLAGMQQRVWAQGGDWHCGAARMDPQRPGLCLQAGFSAHWLSAGASADEAAA